jgi:hypothetical protein
MGYRSDVIAVLTCTKDPKNLLAALGEFTRKNPEDWGALQMEFRWMSPEPEIHVDQERGILTLEVRDVKWYEEFKEVKAFNKLWDFCRDEWEGISGHRWRLGEELEDVHQEWFGEYDVLDTIQFTRDINLTI